MRTFLTIVAIWPIVALIVGIFIGRFIGLMGSDREWGGMRPTYSQEYIVETPGEFWNG